MEKENRRYPFEKNPERKVKKSSRFLEKVNGTPIYYYTPSINQKETGSKARTKHEQRGSFRIYLDYRYLIREYWMYGVSSNTCNLGFLITYFIFKKFLFCRE